MCYIGYMIRKIIKIDEEKCNGCGLCVQACREGAISLVEGKAKLTHEDYCDGLGNCLPVCPEGAIDFDERETLELNVEAIEENSAENNENTQLTNELRQWPIQIKLVPINAGYFNNADLLIAADCAAYACANFHKKYMKGKITIIGCPKLDNTDYTDKLTSILEYGKIKSITVVRMEVPCCSGIANAAINAVKSHGKDIPVEVVSLKII